MAHELRIKHTVSGATIKAIVWVGATRWNGSALVAPSTIADASWATGAVTLTELASSNSTGTTIYTGTIPSVTSGGAFVEVDVFFYDTTPAPGLAEIGQQSFGWDGTRVCSPPLALNGLDPVLIESSISGSSSLVDDASNQLTSINARQAMALWTSALAGVLSGATGTTVTIKAGAKSTSRIVATVDADGNRSALTLTVPT